MSLHRLLWITVGVPNIAEVSKYYSEFGLETSDGAVFSTADGGRQLYLKEAPYRRLLEVAIGVDDVDDIARVSKVLTESSFDVDVATDGLRVVEPLTGVRVELKVAPRFVQTPSTVDLANGPGRIERTGHRAPGVLRSSRVRPRKLGHLVLTSPDYMATASFFSDLIGFKVSDYIAGAGVFMRCTTDHHNLLVLRSEAVYLHHTAWEVEDIDEVGRGATAMIEDHPERHVWGLGRHHAGSNFFWYLRDPAGNYSEYYTDLDYIPENAEWEPESHPGRFGLYNWGPQPPTCFLRPDDVDELIRVQRSDAMSRDLD